MNRFTILPRRFRCQLIKFDANTTVDGRISDSIREHYVNERKPGDQKSFYIKLDVVEMRAFSANAANIERQATGIH